jgi:hypothetical protein
MEYVCECLIALGGRHSWINELLEELAAVTLDSKKAVDRIGVQFGQRKFGAVPRVSREPRPVV